MNIFKIIDNFIIDFLGKVGMFAPIFASILIVLESVFPIMPLAVFITINFYYFGAILGFLLSWILTCLGCYISFLFFRKRAKSKFENKFMKNKQGKIYKLMGIINNISFEKFVLIIALPFTPAFIINIVAGLSSMEKKKFISAILVGKIFMVFFWGFVGTTLLESLQNPIKLLIVLGMLLVAFIVGKFINKKCINTIIISKKYTTS